MTKHKGKINPIDHIANYTKQQRSPASKRRIDFSALSLSNSGYFKHGLARVTKTSSDDSKDETEEFSGLPLNRSHTSPIDRSRPLSDFYEVPVLAFESVAENASANLCSNSKQEGGIVLALESTPVKMQVRDTNEVCRTPGNVVWAKTACNMRWPAECSEERSCNSVEDFQDALKQELKRKEDLSPHAHLLGRSDGSNHSDQQEQSSTKCTSSISSRAEGNFHKKGKGHREKKPSIHFDEVTFALKSARKVRRFKIMRHLGLIAPIGSPF